MRSIEVSGKTVDEALQEGILKLGVRKDNVDVEVLSEATSGLFKILANKPARIKVTVRREPRMVVQEFLQELLRLSGVDGEVAIVKEEEGCIHVTVNGPRLGMLIGKRGNTLSALQYLCNVALRRSFSAEKIQVLLDVGDYRTRREESLRRLAGNMADKAKRTNREVILEPMPPQERRIIHLAIKDHDQVESYSKGEEPFRKVVIAPRIS